MMLGAQPVSEAAARIAAIRETLEEVGLAIGLTPNPSPDTLYLIREGLQQGSSFAELLREFHVSIDLDALVPWARWQPAHEQKRCFDTRFYIIHLPGVSDHACIEEVESVRLIWGEAQRFLNDAASVTNVSFAPKSRTLSPGYSRARRSGVSRV
ncbi:hypothetical protein NRB_49290 [Novosphingobium sp. 11B]